MSIVTSELAIISLSFLHTPFTNGLPSFAQDAYHLLFLFFFLPRCAFEISSFKKDLTKSIKTLSLSSFPLPNFLVLVM